jgi:hypothetical protein
MILENKELLIKDLCARLPYGIQVQDIRCGISGKLHDMLVFPLYKGNNVHDYIATTNFYTDCYYDDIVLFKPYLFPLSSMTEEQKKEFDQLLELELKAINDEINHTQATEFEVDFYHKHHLDWRGLIPMGLAIDATGLNIY